MSTATATATAETATAASASACQMLVSGQNHRSSCPYTHRYRCRHRAMCHHYHDTIFISMSTIVIGLPFLSVLTDSGLINMTIMVVYAQPPGESSPANTSNLKKAITRLCIVSTLSTIYASMVCYPQKQHQLRAWECSALPHCHVPGSNRTTSSKGCRRASSGGSGGG